MGRIIEADRSVVVACDVPFDKLGYLVAATHKVEGVGGYKVGTSFLDVGMVDVVRAIREHTDKPVIYDHQKAGTDVPFTAGRFMDAMVRSGVNAVILFPQSGPVAQHAWTKAAQERELGVIVGGHMTHDRYLAGDSSGDYDELFRELGIPVGITGYMKVTGPNMMYQVASAMGVTDFVMPGNRPDDTKRYRELVVGWGVGEPVVWSPGLIRQGGPVPEAAQAAGERFQAIVGRGIYEGTETGSIKSVAEMRAAAEELTSRL